MAFFKINNIDFSHFVNALTITKTATYNAQTNAAGDSVVDYINTKRTIEVGIIPLSAEAMQDLQSAIDGFGVTLSFINPNTNELEENVSCIIPTDSVSYYTIQIGKVMFKTFTLQFIEL